MIWFAIAGGCGAGFTLLGVYAWRRKKPMWFWSGSTVEEAQIADVPAYNRANGRMWLAFSLSFWASAILGFWSEALATALVAGDCLVGVPVLALAYHRILARHRA